MRLMTKALEKSFTEIGSQDGAQKPNVVANFFNPTGARTWYSTEYDAEQKSFFGYVSIFGDHCDEWGYFSSEELESYRGRFGLGIERDLYWQERRFNEVIRDLG